MKTFYPTILVLVLVSICSIHAAAEIRIDQITCACASGGTGSISVIAEGSAGPFTFLWAGPGGYVSTEQNPADLPAPGQYAVTVTNAYGCAVTLEAVVPECDAVPEPMIEAGATCTGAANGSVSISMPGGNAGYAFVWGGGETESNLSGLSAGSLSVTITNAAGCTREEEITIPEENSLMLTAEIFGVCFQQSEGGIDLSVNGGQAPYTFQWNNVSAQEDLGPVSAGVYQVTVTDATGCTALSSFTVPQHTPPDILGQVQLSSCANNADGSIQINITNGTAPFEYEWNNGALTEDLSNLTGGIYILTVTDDNGCFDQAGFNTMPMTPQDALPYLRRLRITAIHTTTAEETLIYDAEWVEAAGDCLFFLPNETDMPQTVFAQIKNGQRSLRFDAEFSEPMMPSPSMLSPSTSQGMAAGGNAWVFSMTNSAAADMVQNGRIEETFVFTGMDLRGNALFDLRSASNQMSNCAALPRFMPDCVWSPAVSGNNIDNVHTLIRDCMALSLSVNHNNNSASATALGGSAPISWFWEGPDGFTSTDSQISDVPPGRYCLTAKDANGCTTEECIDFCKSLEELVSDLLSITPPCPGQSDGMLCLNTDGDFALQVSWPDGSDELCMTGIAAGQSYCFEVTELRCMQTVEYCTDPVMPVSALSLALSSSRPACPGQMNGALTVTAEGGRGPYVFSWASGQSGSMAAGLAAGICHAVTVTDACGQTFNTCFPVQEAPPLNITDLVVNNACGTTPTGSIRLQLSGLGPMTIVWKNKKGDVIGGNQPFVNQLLPGPYRVDVTDACGQTVTMFMDVGNTNTDAQITLGDPVTTPACAGMGGAVDISVQSPPAFPPSFLWSNGATTEDIFNVAPGSYSVTVTNAFGCQVVQFAEVEDVDFEVILDDLSPAFCGNNNGRVRLLIEGTGGNQQGFSFIWSDGFSNSARNNISAGTYTVSVTKHIDSQPICTKIVEVIIPELIYDVVVNPLTTPPCGNTAGSITLETPGFSWTPNPSLPSFIWSNGQMSNTLQNIPAGQYCVTVTDGNGCMSPPLCMDVEETEPDFEITDVHIIAETIGFIFGNGDGAINLTFSNQTSLRFQWSTGETYVFPPGNNHLASLQALSAGQYSLTITNTFGCSLVRTFLVQACPIGSGSTPDLNIVSIVPIRTSDDPPGAINMSISGGTPPLEFKWTGPSGFIANTLSISGLTQQGVYTLQVTDFCGRRIFFNAPMDCSHIGAYKILTSVQDRCRDNFLELTKFKFRGLSRDFTSGVPFNVLGSDWEIYGGTPVNIEYTDPDGEIVQSGTTNLIGHDVVVNDVYWSVSGPLEEIVIHQSDPYGMYCLKVTDVFGCEYPSSCSSFDEEVCVGGLLTPPSGSIFPGDDYIIAQQINSSLQAYTHIGSCWSCRQPFDGVCDIANSEYVATIRYVPINCNDPCRLGGFIMSDCPSTSGSPEFLMAIPEGTPYLEFVEGLPGLPQYGCLFYDVPGLSENTFYPFNPSIPVYVESQCPTLERDRDNDLVPDLEDNCPTTYNPEQYDCDCDGIGNECDPTPGNIYYSNFEVEGESGRCSITISCIGPPCENQQPVISRNLTPVRFVDDPETCTTRKICVDLTQHPNAEYELEETEHWEYCYGTTSFNQQRCGVFRKCTIDPQSVAYTLFEEMPCAEIPSGIPPCFTPLRAPDQDITALSHDHPTTDTENGASSFVQNTERTIEKVWPNPFDNKISIEISSPVGELADLRLSNILGKLVFDRRIDILPGKTLLEITIPDALPPGVYNLQIAGASGHITSRLLIKQ